MSLTAGVLVADQISTGKDRRGAVVLVVDINDVDQNRTLTGAFHVAERRSTDKDKRPSVVLVVDIMVVDQDRNESCRCP